MYLSPQNVRSVQHFPFDVVRSWITDTDDVTNDVTNDDI